MKPQTIQTTEHPFMRAVQLHITGQLQETTEAYMKLCFNDLNFEGKNSEDVREMGKCVKDAAASATLIRASVRWWCELHGLNLRLVNDVATVLALNCHSGDPDENIRMTDVLRENHLHCFSRFHKEVGFGDEMQQYLTQRDIDILGNVGSDFRISFAIASVYLGVTPHMLTLNEDGSVNIDWYKFGIARPSVQVPGLHWGGTTRHMVL